MPIYPYKKKDGKEFYRYAFEVKDKLGKRKTIKQDGFKGKKEARDAELDARTAWKKGIHVDLSKSTYGEYITTWLKNKQDISEGTRYTNEGQLTNYIIPELGHILLQKVNVTNIEEFIQAMQTKKMKNGKPLSSGTIKKIFNLVQTSFKAATKKELISRNPFDLLEDAAKPRVEDVQIDYWSKEEVKRFLGGFDDRLKIIFLLAIHTGMRRGEILGLRWKDIDFDNAMISIRQIQGFKGRMKDGAKTTAGDRSISISPSLLSELNKHRLVIESEKRWFKQESGKKYSDNDLVACQKDGRAVSWGNFHKFWVRRLDKLKVRHIRFHDLRHTCASLLLSGGVHPKVVQELLGHSSIKVTLDLYSHTMPNMQSDAVKALDQMLK